MATSVKSPSKIPTTERVAALRLQLVMSEMSELVGRQIRRRREELGLNQRELADRVVALNPAKNGAVTNQTISNWERGVNEPGARYKSELASALEVDVSYLVRDDRKNGTTPSPFPAKAIEGTLAGVLADIQAQLEEQNRVLDDIKRAVQDERAAASEAREATRRLLAAVDQTRPALRGETPPPVAEPDRPAKSG